jgi:hypothetical protein
MTFDWRCIGLKRRIIHYAAILKKFESFGQSTAFAKLRSHRWAVTKLGFRQGSSVTILHRSMETQCTDEELLNLILAKRNRHGKACFEMAGRDGSEGGPAQQQAMRAGPERSWASRFMAAVIRHGGRSVRQNSVSRFERLVIKWSG